MDRPRKAEAPQAESRDASSDPGFWRFLGLLVLVFAMIVFWLAGAWLGWRAIPDGSPVWLRWAGTVIGFLIAVYAVLGMIWFPMQSTFAMARAKAAAMHEARVHPVLAAAIAIVLVVPVAAVQMRPAYQPRALQRALAERAAEQAKTTLPPLVEKPAPAKKKSRRK